MNLKRNCSRARLRIRRLMFHRRIIRNRRTINRKGLSILSRKCRKRRKDMRWRWLGKLKWENLWRWNRRLRRGKVIRKEKKKSISWWEEGCKGKIKCSNYRFKEGKKCKVNICKWFHHLKSHYSSKNSKNIKKECSNNKRKNSKWWKKSWSNDVLSVSRRSSNIIWDITNFLMKIKHFDSKRDN